MTEEGTRAMTTRFISIRVAISALDFEQALLEWVAKRTCTYGQVLSISDITLDACSNYPVQFVLYTEEKADK